MEKQKKVEPPPPQVKRPKVDKQSLESSLKEKERISKGDKIVRK